MPVRITCLAPMLNVNSVSETVSYYRDSLGFTVSLIAESPSLATYAIVQRDGFEVHFVEDTGQNGADVLSGINARVDDVDALYLEFKERGAFAPGFPRHLDEIREHGPEDKEYGMRDIIFVDPNGFVLVFGQPLHDGE